jgi:D-glycero-D-manno-heptose 1,7-bisphosphate phosphatase
MAFFRFSANPASFLLVKRMMKAAVFFERDGVLNRLRAEARGATPLTLDQFVFNEEAVEPLWALKAVGYLLLVTTNQPGLSRGYQSRRELDLMHDLLRKRLQIDDILVCPHDEMDDCPCRKPKPGLLQEAAFKWHLDLDRCFVVSDKWQDAEAARNAGCTSFLIRSPLNGAVHRDFTLSSLPAVVHKILQRQLGALCPATRESEQVRI